jgi:hypothetical protein
MRRIISSWAHTFLITLGTFYLCFYLQTAALNFRSFASWLTSYSPEVGFVFNVKASIIYTLRGHFRLLFGGRFNFLREAINPFTITLTSMLTFACAAFVIQLLRKPQEIGMKKEPDRIHHDKQLAVFCVVWAIPYLIFLFFWIPQNTFYRLFYLPSLIVLIGILLKRRELPDARSWRA